MCQLRREVRVLNDELTRIKSACDNALPFPIFSFFFYLITSFSFLPFWFFVLCDNFFFLLSSIISLYVSLFLLWSFLSFAANFRIPVGTVCHLQQSLHNFLLFTNMFHHSRNSSPVSPRCCASGRGPKRSDHLW